VPKSTCRTRWWRSSTESTRLAVQIDTRSRLAATCDRPSILGVSRRAHVGSPSSAMKSAIRRLPNPPCAHAWLVALVTVAGCGESGNPVPPSPGGGLGGLSAAFGSDGGTAVDSLTINDMQDVAAGAANASDGTDNCDQAYCRVDGGTSTDTLSARDGTEDLASATCSRRRAVCRRRLAIQSMVWGSARRPDRFPHFLPATPTKELQVDAEAGSSALQRQPWDPYVSISVTSPSRRARLGMFVFS